MKKLLLLGLLLGVGYVQFSLYHELAEKQHKIQITQKKINKLLSDLVHILHEDLSHILPVPKVNP